MNKPTILHNDIILLGTEVDRAEAEHFLLTLNPLQRKLYTTTRVFSTVRSCIPLNTNTIIASMEHGIISSFVLQDNAFVCMGMYF